MDKQNRTALKIYELTSNPDMDIIKLLQQQSKSKEKQKHEEAQKHIHK